MLLPIPAGRRLKRRLKGSHEQVGYGKIPDVYENDAHYAAAEESKDNLQTGISNTSFNGQA